MAHIYIEGITLLLHVLSFSHDANPVIGDINGYLPLHHAVLNNHESVIDTFLEFFPKAYTVRILSSNYCIYLDISCFHIQVL